MCRRNHKKGFTLVELIVVLVILAILAAILIPSMIGWIGKAEAGVCATNAGIVRRTMQLWEVSGEAGTPEEALEQALGEMPDAPCPSGGTYSVQGGRILCSVHGDLGDVERERDIQGYLERAQILLGGLDAGAQTTKIVKALQADFLAYYGGGFPALSETEKGILGMAGEYHWRPTLASDGSVLMVGTAETNPDKANLNVVLIYYEGNYYFHDNGYNKKDSSYIPDNGSFDTALLKDAPQGENLGDKTSRWVQYKA